MYKKLGLVLIIAGISSPVLATPTGLNVTIYCPNDAQDTSGQNKVTNFGSFIGGMGYEVIENVVDKKPIYFKSQKIDGKNYSFDLKNYSHNSTSYKSTNGEVTCHYVSTNAYESPFDVSYKLLNGKGGVITDSFADSIKISLPIGL